MTKNKELLNADDTKYLSVIPTASPAWLELNPAVEITMNDEKITISKGVMSNDSAKGFSITPKYDGDLELCFSCTDSKGAAKNGNLTVTGLTETVALTGTPSVVKLTGVKANTAITCTIDANRLNFFGAVFFYEEN